MALSGSFYTNVGAGWRLQLEWSGTQSIANNTTTITANLYWMSLGSSYTVNSSATKDCSIYIDGTWNGKSASGLASLSGNQKKLIHSYQKVVNHNADGTKSVTLDGWFDAEVTLSGVYYGRIDLTGQTYTLPTIPRASTVSSNVSWTAGTQNLSITVNRASTSFTHQALLYVKNPSNQWIYIGETDLANKFATSVVFAFDSTHIARTYEALAQYENRPAKIELRTYSGTTLIGTSTKETTVGAIGVTPATISFENFNIGDSIEATVINMYSGFTYSAKFTFGAFEKTFPLVYTDTTPTFTFTPEEIEAMYNETPNSNSMDGNVFVSSQYIIGTEINDGYPVNQNFGFTAFVTNSNPTMGDLFSYSDSNGETVLITNNNTYIIQNYSTVRVVIPVSSRASAKNSAEIVQYVATLAGVEAVEPYSSTTDVVINFGSINASVDQTLSIRAIDSRGNSVEKTKIVTMIPYAIPSINATATRESGFENETTLTMNGEISLITINGINKNAVQNVYYRYKPYNLETYEFWDTWQPFTWAVGLEADEYVATDVLLDLDNTISWHIEFRIDDILENRIFATTVGTGRPILYIDNAKKSLSIGKFVDIPHSFSLDVEGIVKAQGFYGEHNQTNGMVEDYLNGNVAVNALGGSLYLGFKGTTRITLRADLYNDDFTRVLVSKNGLFKGTSFTTHNPNNANATAVFDWFTDQPRIRYGGTGVGYDQGFSIQGAGDSIKFQANNDGSCVIGGSRLYFNQGTWGDTSTGKPNIEAVDGGLYLHHSATDYLRVKSGEMNFYSGGNDHIGIYWYGSIKFHRTEAWLESRADVTAPAGIRAPMDYAYTQARDGLRVTAPFTTAGWKPVLASAFTVNSYREDKTNIAELPTGALEKVMATKIYDYHLHDELEEVIGYEDNDVSKPKKKAKDPKNVKKRLGILHDEAPSEVLDGDTGQMIDLYGLTSLLWKAVQELSDEVKSLRNKLPQNNNNNNTV